MKSTPKKQNGFTLIEIVIVLAIAALIMVIVFLAVQGAQRSRRDTAKKNDVNRIIALAENFASANGGKYPTGSSNFQAQYVDKEFGTGKYIIVYDSAGVPADGATKQVFVDGGGTCATNGSGLVLGNGNGLASSTRLEVGLYCQTTTSP